MAKNKNVQEGDPKKNNNPNKPQKITIEVQKYKTLVDALGDPKRVIRVVVTVFLIGILLFSGITVITLAIKRLYPYSDITTNGLGATTIKSEKNEVSYWLFNTATLWTNSGIPVDKGDIITIRASGKSHTAIHHLYDAAKNNIEKRNDWVGSEGEPDMMSDGQDSVRRRFRIFPDMPSGALLMQVSEGEPKDMPHDQNADPDNFYFIGKERQHIYINNKGTLHFAVNDIILNRATIAGMMWETIRLKYKETDPLKKATPEQKETIDAFVKAYPRVDLDYQLRLYTSNKEEEQRLMDTIKGLFETIFRPEIEKANQMNLSSNDSIKKHACDEKIGKMRLGYSRLSENSLTCELSYYYGNTKEENDKRKTVWFDDNIGSFLIVVEKTK